MAFLPFFRPLGLMASVISVSALAGVAGSPAPVFAQIVPPATVPAVPVAPLVTLADLPPAAIPAVKTLLDTATAALKAGKSADALAAADRALAAAKDAKDLAGEARAQNARAATLDTLNRSTDATEARKGEANAWGKFAPMLYATHDLQRFKVITQYILVIQERLAPDSLDVAGSLNKLGIVTDEQGDVARAKIYLERALAMFERLSPGSLAAANSLNNLGLVVRDQGDLTSAKSYYERALAIDEKLTPGSLAVANILNNLGHVADDQGDLTSAKSYHERSLALREKQSPDSIDVARSLNNLGNVASKQGDLTGATSYAKRAWQIALHQANSVNGDEAGQSFTALIQEYADSLLSLQLKAGQTEAAFVTLEQGRARSLSTLLLDHRLLTTQSPAASTAWDAYQSAARAQNKATQALSEAGGGGGTNNAAAFTAAQNALTQARLATEARYADLKRAAPGNALSDALPPEKARLALPADALFAAFSVGEKESTLFLLVRTGKVQAFPLTITQKQLAAQVAELRLDVTDYDTPVSVTAAAGRKLFNSLFPVGAARNAVLAAKRLILSPDDVLWDAPFAALVVDAAGTNKTAPSWLGLRVGLTVTPSLTVLAQVRKQPRPTTLVSVAAVSALVVGDPQFERGVSTQPVLVAANLSTANTERRYLWEEGKPPVPLPGTRDEARQIAALYGSVGPLLGAAATEAAVRDRLKHGVTVLHLATHGFLRRDVPTASGVLLAASATETDDSSNDGALQTWEMASLDLSHTELAVLSACETARGTRKVGEGLVGLTRALQAAGCRSVVTSQWSVSDKATVSLMCAFHKGLRSGMDKDVALRSAMAATASQSMYQAPYYWAAFLLTGDADNGSLGGKGK